MVQKLMLCFLLVLFSSRFKEGEIVAIKTQCPWLIGVVKEIYSGKPTFYDVFTVRGIWFVSEHSLLEKSEDK